MRDVRRVGAGSADVVIGVLLLGLAGAIAWLARGIPSPPFVPVTPAFFPTVLAAVLAVLAALLVLRGVRGGPAGTGGRSGALGPPLLVFGPLAAYLLVVPVLGFFTSTFLFVLAEGLLLGGRTRRDLARALLVAAGTTAGCYLVFERYLRVLFPEGLIG